MAHVADDLEPCPCADCIEGDQRKRLARCAICGGPSLAISPVCAGCGLAFTIQRHDQGIVITGID